MPDTSSTPNDWFMYHAGYGHGGNASKFSSLNSDSFKSGNFGLLYQIRIDGSILSVPAVVDGFIYVGLANSLQAKGSNGGSLQKYEVSSGNLICEFKWDIDVKDRDTHGFTGMGCTPTVINNCVYFIGFNAVLYCLKQDDLTLLWQTNLRNPDPAHNQPTTNILGMEAGYAPAAGWSSPTVVNMMEDGVEKHRIFLGVGEGENPYLFSFIFCLDADSGDVVWIYCTCQYEEGKPNPVNQLPAQVVADPNNLPAMFTTFSGYEVTRGCSVWSAIAYDEETGYLYASTGQPASPNNTTTFDTGLPSVGWSSGILAIKALSGEFVAFTQMPAKTSYRPSDLDVDIGSACTLYTLPPSLGFPNPRKVVAVGCKNGGFMICEAHTLQLINSVSLLPKMNDGTQIPEIDLHPPGYQQDMIGVHVPNEISNINGGENYFGPFNTAAIDPQTGTLFIGMGGPNYHFPGPGIDFNTTPFMKAIAWDSLADKWPMDNSNPPKYSKVGASMYTNAGECGLSSPAVVNDVVLVATTQVSIYAFLIEDGTLLWQNYIGSPTAGFSGGYGYCLGPAIWDKYVVAGALIQGDNGGVLNIYSLK